jgi:hypothetical protein
MAWRRASLEATAKGFKKCCISNAVDGTDDDMLWNGIVEDGDLRSEREEDEGTESTEKPHVIKSKKLQTFEIYDASSLVTSLPFSV